MIRAIFGIVCFVVLVGMLIKSWRNDKDSFMLFSAIICGVLCFSAVVFVPLFLLLLGKVSSSDIVISVATVIIGGALGWGVIAGKRAALVVMSVVLLAAFGFCLYTIFTTREDLMSGMAFGGALLSALLLGGLIKSIRSDD